MGYGLLVWGGLLSISPFSLGVHELGHAAAAAVFGRRIYQINIGSGPPFKIFRLGRTLLVFGRDLAAGYTVAVPLKTRNRLASMVILAAGATANIAAAGFLAMLGDEFSASSNAAAAFALGAILSNLGMAAVALFPGYHIRDGQSQPSDGLQMLQLLRQRPSMEGLQMHHDAFQGADLLHAKLWDAAEAHYRDAFTRHPNHPAFLTLLMHVLSISKGYEAAMSCAEQHDAFLRQDHQLSETMAPHWSFAWSTAAWAFLRSPNGNLAAADTFLRKALDAYPFPLASAVQGAILARAGDPAKGLATILGNLNELGDPRNKLEFCDFIIAENLESAELKAPDFVSYAAHLRTLA